MGPCLKGVSAPLDFALLPAEKSPFANAPTPVHRPPGHVFRAPFRQGAWHDLAPRGRSVSHALGTPMVRARAQGVRHSASRRSHDSKERRGRTRGCDSGGHGRVYREAKARAERVSRDLPPGPSCLKAAQTRLHGSGWSARCTLTPRDPRLPHVSPRVTPHPPPPPQLCSGRCSPSCSAGPSGPCGLGRCGNGGLTPPPSPPGGSYSQDKPRSLEAAPTQGGRPALLLPWGPAFW